MKLSALLVFVLEITISYSTGKCWYTECQPNGRSMLGCKPHGNETGMPIMDCRGERAHRGKQYYCCSSDVVKRNDPPPPTPIITELVTFTQFQNALTKNGFKSPSREQFNNFNKYAQNIGGIVDAEEAAMALAHIIYESDGLRRTREGGDQVKSSNSFTFTSQCRLPDQFYLGKGYLKLRGCNNYFTASEAIYGDFRLHENPDQVAEHDNVAWATSMYLWGDRAHPVKEVQMGKFGASIKELTEDECTTLANWNAETRFKIYGVIRQAFDLPGMGDPSGCR